MGAANLIEDFTTAVKAQLYERVSSPLLSSFALSWCGWNYKFLLVVLSGMSSHEKIVYIDMNIFPSVWSIVMHGAALPLITCLFLIFLYPIPAEYIYKHVKIQQRRLKEIQQSIDDDSPLSKEQARKIRREALGSQLKYESEIDSKISENSRLKELVSELQQKVDEFAKVPVNSSPQGSEEAISSKKNELVDEGADFLAAYNEVKNSPLPSEHESVLNDSDTVKSNKDLDGQVSRNILNYINSRNLFSGSTFRVLAENGQLKILIAQPDGTFFPYITSVYTEDTAGDVITSVRSALASDLPLTDSVLDHVSESYARDETYEIVKSMVLKELSMGVSVSDIRKKLVAKGVLPKIISDAITDIKNSLS
ncbi:hypothetical protein ACOYXF_08805 [Pseudomonas sp. Tul1A2]